MRSLHRAGVSKAGDAEDRNGTTFNYLARSESADEKMVSRVGIEHVGEPERRSHLPENHGAQPRRAKRDVVTLTFASWNHVARLLLQIQALRQAA